jgi:4-hydroxy-3-methylbut-2-enyl diphosphate reductase
VVDSLKAKGAIFVEELDEVPDGVPVVFSAHGVPKAVPAKAEERGLTYVDATCPLVSKVHRQAERLVAGGCHILFIGHQGHPEVIGTFGQVPEGAMTLIETLEDAAAVQPPNSGKLGFLTQTTLSVDDTSDMVAELKRRFPAIEGPRGDDICYATSNRQAAVKAMAPRCDLVLVIGAANSSNSQRLREVAEREGARSWLIQRAAEIDWAWFDGVTTVGLTAGASAPEVLVQEVLAAMSERFSVSTENITTAVEEVVFKLPRSLSA